MSMKIIIAGGGTGGHLFPGVAIAEEFIGRNPGNTVLFIGTEKGLERKILGDMGFQLRTINIAGVRGKGPVKTFTGLTKIPLSMVQSYSIIRDFCPDLIIGVGGYASGPVVVTGHYMGKRTVIAEQNAVPGLTNRILRKFVDKVFVTFVETEKWFAKKNVVVTGNPVRAGFIGKEAKLRKTGDKFTLLIFGGSQGASAINNTVVDALTYLEKIRDEIKIIHQTGRKDVDKLTKAYTDHRIDADVFPFIYDMASAYDSADLLICRAGATTIAEITAKGKAVFLIPFPFAAGDHQRLNAQVLVNAGAAEMMLEKDLDGKKLAHVIGQLFHNRERIKQMEEKSRTLGNVKAAANIVDECLELMRQRRKGKGSKDQGKR